MIDILLKIFITLFTYQYVNAKAVEGNNEQQPLLSSLSSPIDEHSIDNDMKQTPENSTEQIYVQTPSEIILESNWTSNDQEHQEFTTIASPDVDASDDNGTLSLNEIISSIDDDQIGVLVERIGDNITEFNNITADVVELSETVIDSDEVASKILNKHSSINLKLNIISLVIVGAFLFILYSYCLY